jgi:methylphosphotriester-DNA--protein-cysteine methyltransferase
VKLLNQIKKPIAFAERCELMQNFLLDSFRQRQQKDYYLHFEKMFVTSKTINRYFHKVVGISPKNYFSVVRSRAALTHYVNHKEDFTPYNFGYYDMSHFYKEVVRFTGKKLVDYAVA